MDDHLNMPSALYDHPWAGPVLWGFGSFKERAFNPDAMFYHGCFDEDPLGPIRL